MVLPELKKDVCNCIYLLLVMQVQSCVLLVHLGLARQVLEGLLQTHLAGNFRGRCTYYSQTSCKRLPKNVLFFSLEYGKCQDLTHALMPMQCFIYVKSVSRKKFPFFLLRNFHFLH